MHSFSKRCGGQEDGLSMLNISDKLTASAVEHYILDCSVELFLAKYPFLRSQEPGGVLAVENVAAQVRGILQSSARYDTINHLLPTQVMPSEIIQGSLYQGNAKHAADPNVISSLGKHALKSNRCMCLP